MSKRTVTRVFGASLAALAAGLILLFAAGGLAYANGNFVMDGPDVVGVRWTPLGWWMVALAVVALLTVLASLVAQVVAWIGALVNTAQLDDKTWFVVLLASGLLSVGFLAMLIYIVAGPDDRQPALHIVPQQTGTSTDLRELVR